MRSWMPLVLAALLALFGCDDSGGSGDPAAGGGTDAGAGGSGGAGGGAGGMGGGDSTAATIEITSPENGAALNTRRVEITGTVAGAAADITVNGVVAERSGEDWTAVVEFAEQGTQTVTATGGGGMAEITVTIDTLAPRINIAAPARGTWQGADMPTTDLQFEVIEAGSGLEFLDLEGRGVELLGESMFTVDGLSLQKGVNLFRLAATDRAGNVGNEHAAVLHGDTRPADEPLVDALRARVGREGLAAVGVQAARLLDEQDLSMLLPPDALNIPPPFEVSIGEIRHAVPSDVLLEPADGYIAATVRLHDLQAQLDFLIGQNMHFLTVRVNPLTVTAKIYPDIIRDENGGPNTIDLRIEEVEFDLENLNVAFDRPPEDLDDEMAGEGFVIQALEGVAGWFVENQLPDLIDDLFGGLQEPIEVDVLGAMLRIEWQPSFLGVDIQGLALKVDATVGLANPDPSMDGLPGYIGEVSGWGEVPRSDRIALAVDDDFVNLFLFQIWRSGVLFPIIDRQFALEQGQTGTLVLGVLGTLVRNAYPDLGANHPVKAITNLPTPPVVRMKKGAGGGLLELGVADLDLRIDSEQTDMELIDGAASLTLAAAVGVSIGEMGALGLDLEIQEFDAVFDVESENLRGDARRHLAPRPRRHRGRVGHHRRDRAQPGLPRHRGAARRRGVEPSARSARCP
jgi:hypothetical protein